MPLPRRVSASSAAHRRQRQEHLCAAMRVVYYLIGSAILKGRDLLVCLWRCLRSCCGCICSELCSCYKERRQRRRDRAKQNGGCCGGAAAEHEDEEKEGRCDWLLNILNNARIKVYEAIVGIIEEILEVFREMFWWTKQGGTDAFDEQIKNLKAEIKDLQEQKQICRQKCEKLVVKIFRIYTVLFKFNELKYSKKKQKDELKAKARKVEAKKSDFEAQMKKYDELEKKIKLAERDIDTQKILRQNVLKRIANAKKSNTGGCLGPREKTWTKGQDVEVLDAQNIFRQAEVKLVHKNKSVLVRITDQKGETVSEETRLWLPKKLRQRFGNSRNGLAATGGRE